VVISCSEALAYPARRRIADQFSAAAGDRDRHDLQTARITYGGLSMLELSIGAAVVVVAVVGVTIGRAGQVSFGQLTAFVLILLMVSAPAQLAVGLLRDGRYAVSGWKRIDRLQRGLSRERQLGS
jgi:ABC-type multidrug transport system fused ATPase/permease subunit